jgi:hypothetical protein
MKRLLYFMEAIVLLGSQNLQAQWIYTNGPDKGTVMCFLVNGSNLFAGTVDRGVSLSTNNGISWTEVNTGLIDTALAYSQRINALAMIGSNLFAGSSTFIGSGGVFLSTNNGASWSTVNTGLTKLDIRSFAVNGSNLFAGTDGGVFLSTNNGTSWTAVNTGLTNTYITSFAVKDSNLFAGTNGGGVFLSTNNGTSWSAVNNGLTNLSISALAVNGSHLFAGTWDDGVFLSTNNGTNWTNVKIGLDFIFVTSFAVHGSNLFAGTVYGGVFLSTDNGTSWAAVNIGLTQLSVNALIVSGSNLFAGTYWGSGVWRRPLSEMVTGVEYNFSQAPVGFTLEQNYPNPFNPTTIIKYQLPQSAEVLLKIYDILGKSVRTLVDEKQISGNYYIIWDGKGDNGQLVNSGIYMYKIHTQNFVKEKKMVLIR